MSDLDRELATYRTHLPEFADKQGKYVLIHGDSVQGVFETYADALAAGYEKNKLEAFLVKQIEAHEQAAFMTRDVLPCPT